MWPLPPRTACAARAASGGDRPSLSSHHRLPPTGFIPESCGGAGPEPVLLSPAVQARDWHNALCLCPHRRQDPRPGRDCPPSSRRSQSMMWQPRHRTLQPAQYLAPHASCSVSTSPQVRKGRAPAWRLYRQAACEYCGLGQIRRRTLSPGAPPESRAQHSPPVRARDTGRSLSRPGSAFPGR